MKTVLPFATLVASAASQSTFEPADFNITEALFENGVNVSALPDLASLAERASISGCSVAVSDHKHLLYKIGHCTDCDKVQIPQPYLR